jgi:cyclopropane fatty-acyl-phospholipid synthase-like methyltransferase
VTFFDNAYEGTPTWDIGRPQGALVRLAEAGLIEGSVIDLGCGTGEGAIYLAGLGHEALGVDLAAAAIRKARDKAQERNSIAEFLLWDALRLGELDRRFDSAVDVGCFHTLPPELRSDYAASVRAVLKPGGRLHMLCWSDRNEFGYGPERISRSDIRATFTGSWVVESIADDTLETLMKAVRVHALLVRLRRD